MNIAYSCNEAYVQHTGISMISLFENNKEVNEIKIYFIAKDVSNQSIDILKDICLKYSRIFILVPFEQICYDLKLQSTGRHIETVYAKLFFSRISTITKMIYLDSDVIINGSLEEMYEYQLGENYFGLTKTVTKDKAVLLDLSFDDDFFNDGVALVNIGKLREDNMIKKFTDAIEFYHGNPPVLSEGIINKVCKGMIMSLPPKFNFAPTFYMINKKKIDQITNKTDYFTLSEINEAMAHPIVIHYLDGWFNRPWSKYCTHPLKEKYLSYKSQSPWANVPLENKKLSVSARKMKFLYKYFYFAIHIKKKYGKKNN